MRATKRRVTGKTGRAGSQKGKPGRARIRAGSTRRKMGWGCRCEFLLGDEGAAKPGRCEFTAVESRVPKAWSLERRREALAHRLRRKLKPDRVARMLNVLGSAHRLRILGTLAGGGATYRQLVKATKLRAGPLYHHVNQLRLAGLVLPKERDLYEITARGKKYLLLAAAVGNMR